MAQLGFVGLGIMGAPIAARLLAAGHEVAGYNRTAAKAAALVEAGLRLCESPRAVAENAEIIFSMVSDTAALSAVTQGDHGIIAGLSAGKIYVDLSTVSPGLIRDLATQAEAQGAHMLEAPVSGSVPAAQGGTLVMFVGGDAETLEQVRAVLEVLSQKIIHVGTHGQGIATKIAINMNLPIQLITLFEGVLLAERSGVARAHALDALLNSVIASPAMKYRAPFMLNPPDDVWFSVTMMEKDIRLALDLGQELGVPLASAQLALDLLRQASAMGYGDADFAALFNVIAQRAGVD